MKSREARNLDHTGPQKEEGFVPSTMGEPLEDFKWGLI